MPGFVLHLSDTVALRTCVSVPHSHIVYRVRNSIQDRGASAVLEPADWIGNVLGITSDPQTKM